MMSLLEVIQTVLALLLIIFIIMQSRGSGLGSAWGGSGQFYATRRGMEKILLRATVATAAGFIVLSLWSLISLG